MKVDGIMKQTNYDHLIEEIWALPLSAQLLLLEQTAAIVRTRAGEIPKSRSIMELKGKVKELWEQANVSNYLEEERSSWTG